MEDDKKAPITLRDAIETLIDQEAQLDDSQLEHVRSFFQGLAGKIEIEHIDLTTQESAAKAVETLAAQQQLLQQKLAIASALKRMLIATPQEDTE